MSHVALPVAEVESDGHSVHAAVPFVRLYVPAGQASHEGEVPVPRSPARETTVHSSSKPDIYHHFRLTVDGETTFCENGGSIRDTVTHTAANSSTSAPLKTRPQTLSALGGLPVRDLTTRLNWTPRLST